MNMDLTRIYRGMENGAESIEENFNKIGAAVDSTSRTFQKSPKKNRCGQVHGMAELQETVMFLLNRYRSVRTGGFSNGKNIKKTAP